MEKTLNAIKILVVVSAAVLFYVFFKDDVTLLYAKYFPCSRPISYEVGAFDERFGITRQDFLRIIGEAEAIWEGPVSRELFAEKDGGLLKINLIYDDRQKATEILDGIESEIDESKDSYESVRAEYDALKTRFETDKRLYEQRKEALNIRLSAYNAEVSKWNTRGGAPRDTYAELEREKASIDKAIVEVNSLNKELSSEVDRVNALIPTLNRLASEHNIDVSRYNTIGENYREFEEGTYTVDTDGPVIDIYQFDDEKKLLRVMAHELGHALGLDHVSDPEAIMYYLNHSQNDVLSEDDILALKTHCGLE